MPPHIMVIDDDPLLLAMYHAVLESAGYTVALYADPVLALAEVEQVKPDLVIIDWLFGTQAEGLAVMQQLRHSRTTAAIGVLVCSGATTLLELRASELTAQGVAVLQKPFMLEDLFATIPTLLMTA